jgi:superfamily II DNA helicase RecQ
VLLTGGGKSLLFQLPTCLPGAGITVVILPLVALRQDLTRQCEKLKISYSLWDEVWDQELNLYIALLLLVGVEQAVSSRFRTYLSQLNHSGRLDRIVLDEAYLSLTAADYRPLIGLLNKLRRQACPFVALSATLPPSMTERLKEELMMPRAISIRSTINRPNLSYRVTRLLPPTEAQRKSGPYG